MNMRYLAVFGIGAALLALPTSFAEAKGCNGYVNQFEWGCAAWDNNNGPKFPHYHGASQPAKAPPAAAPAKVAAPAITLQRPAAPLIAPPATTQSGSHVVNTNGSNIVSQGGGNIVSQGGGNIVSQGGGNFKH